MTEAFSQRYAEVYDLLYADKDYDGECNVIQQALQTHGAAAVTSILDLGCGTGNHALPLADRGIHVVGVDRSIHMLRQAAAKARGRSDGAEVWLVGGDIRRVPLRSRFEAVVMMFAVLSYQTEDADVAAALRNARERLEPGGLFVFEYWNAPGVLRQRPSRRTRDIRTSTGVVRRTGSGVLDPARNRCDVEMILEVDEAGTTTRVAERHPMRYFFPDEMRALMSDHSFELVDVRPAPGEAGPLDLAWNVFAVARAVAG